MAPGIHQINTRSWETLVLITLNLGIVTAMGTITKNRNKYTRQQYNNDTVNSAVYEIILQENIKVSAVTEAQEIIESEFDENDLYRIDNMSLKEKKGKLKLHKREFECELKNTYNIEIQNYMTCIHDNEVNNITE